MEKWLEVCEQIDGAMAVNELEWLHNIALTYNSVVEIGSFKGRSTFALCSANHAYITSVDHFKIAPNERNHPHPTQRNLSIEFWKNCVQFKNLTQITMPSKIAATLFENNSVDVVFIDGDHSHRGITSDLKAWYPKCKHMICGHDTGGVIHSLDAFFGENVIQEAMVENCIYGIWYVLKN